MSKTELENIWIILNEIKEVLKSTEVDLDIQKIRFNTLIELIKKTNPELLPDFLKVSNDRIRAFLNELPSEQKALYDDLGLLD